MSLHWATITSLTPPNVIEDGATQPAPVRTMLQYLKIGQRVITEIVGKDLVVVAGEQTNPDSTDWIAWPYAADCAAYGSGFLAPAYYKDPFGWVHCRGLLLYSGGAVSTTTVFGTLPVGFRPPGQQGFNIPTPDGTSLPRVDVNTAGQLIWQSANTPTNPFIFLDQIHFRVA